VLPFPMSAIRDNADRICSLRVLPPVTPSRPSEANLPLKIAAKVDKVDQAYFEHKVSPLIDGKDIEFIREIDESQKADFLGNAVALLFQICWPEPFGLVMV
jgi:hypothetical protein